MLQNGKVVFAIGFSLTLAACGGGGGGAPAASGLLPGSQPPATSQSLVHNHQGPVTSVVSSSQFHILGPVCGNIVVNTNAQTVFTPSGYVPKKGDYVFISTGDLGCQNAVVTASTVALSGYTPSPSPSPTATPFGATPTPRPSNAPTPTPRPSNGPTPTPRPSIAPTPTPQPTSAPSNVATYYGCPVFTAGDWYNADITNAAVDPNSARYISAAQAAGNTGGFFASDGYEKVNNGTNGTPLLTVHQKVSYHRFPAPYPWQKGYYIEPAGDAHATVFQVQSCHLYESYSTSYSGGTLSAYSGANWDLTKPFVPSPPGNPSAMASGLSIFAGMVKWEDYQSGVIRHALNFEAPQHSIAKGLYVLPASDNDGLGTSPYLLMDGAHLRLKASFQLSCGSSCPEAQAVVAAMKHYGIYLADTGNSGDGLYFANAQDGSNPWNGRDLGALGQVHISDFDLLTLPTIQHM